MRTHTKPPCNSRVRTRRCTFAAALAALTLGAVSAKSQIISFEQGTIPGTVSSEGITISNQYETSLGVSFSLEDRVTHVASGFPKLAEVGAPQTAFQGVANAGGAPAYGTEDGVAASDFGLTGRFFLTDDGVVSGAPDDLVITYAVATAEASGVILDIDGNEKWNIDAYDASDVLLQSVILTTTTPHTGDGLATPWSFNRVAADIKKIKIRFTGTASGGVGLAFDRFSPSAGSGPTMNTTAATLVTLTSATLNGTGNPNGTSTTAHFEWGTTTGYGNVIADHNLGAGTSDVAVSDAISGLSPHTTYHFKIFGTNTFGSNDGGDQTFTTSNTTPTANGQSVSTNEDTNLPITLTGNDGDGDTLTFNITDPPDHGSLTPTGGGGFTYDPDQDYNGPDSFKFTVSDGFGGTSSEATVNITVNSQNDPPVIVVPGLQTINEDSGANAIPGLSVSDPDGDTPTMGYTQGAKGSVSGTFPTLSYTPNANATGSDSFDITADDGNGGTDTKTVNIFITAINDPPVANSQSVSVNSGSNVDVTMTGSDVDGPTMTFIIVDGPLNGVLGPVTGAVVNYTPTPGYSGPDSFTFKINDGTDDSNVATVSITVNQVGQPPVAVDDYAFCGGMPVLVDVLANDTDPENDTLTIQSFTQPASGTVTMVSGQLQYAPVGVLGSIQTFTYTVSDGFNTDTATVSIYPLPAAGSSYAGLIADNSNDTRGILIFRLTKGAYGTGALIIDGRRYPFRGSLLADRNILAGRGANSVLLRISIGAPVGGNLSLHYVVQSLSLSGDAEQSPYSRTNPAPQLGRYTVHLARQLGGTGPRTGGALQGTVINIGRVRLAGKLGNGEPVSGGSFILTGNRVPLYFAAKPPGPNVHTLSGELQIGTGAAPQVTQSLHFLVPAGTDAHLPLGVDEDYDATGARYSAVPKTPRGMLALNGAFQVDLTLTGPTIGSPASILKVLGNSIYLYGGMPVPYMTFAPGSGLFNGKYYPPASPANPVYFFGVMVQGTGLNFGAGSVVEDTGIGTCDLVPRP